MPIKVGYGESTVLYEFSNFENDEYILKNVVDDHEITLKTPLKLDSTFNEEEFDLYFLAKKDVKENDVFQVFDSNTTQRIGWAIPVNSLESSEHDYATNIHFLRYAYVGITKILKSTHDSIYRKELSSDLNSIKLSDIFHESTVILIISKATLQGEIEFEIDRATPSLINYGYTKLTTRNPENITFTSAAPENKRVDIVLISNHIDNFNLISELLNDSFAYEKKPIFQFFFIYQIIELLIDDVYKSKQEEILLELIEVEGDSGGTKEVLDKLQSFMSEKKRLRLLINDYSKINGQLGQLKVLSNMLLTSLQRKNGDNFENYFYTIRNFIFHQYRDFPSSSEILLENVIKEVIDIIPILLSKYKDSEPTPNI